MSGIKSFHVLLFLSLIGFLLARGALGKKIIDLQPSPIASVTKNDSVQLTCTYSKSGVCPGNDFEWWLNGAQAIVLHWLNGTCELYSGNSSLEFSCSSATDKCISKLTLRQVTDINHGDNWTCVSDHTESAETTVHVYYPPVINPLQNWTVIASSSLTVNCTTTPGNPELTSYKWTMSTDNWSHTGQTLSLPSVTKTDAAVYTCTAWNMMTTTGGSVVNGTDTEAFTLNVLYPPVVIPLQNTTVIVSSNVTVNCTTTPGYPAQTSYKWTRSIDNWSQTGQSLSLSSVTKGDAAEYTCTAWNVMTPTEGSAENGTDVKNFTAYILYPPVINPLQDRDVIASSNVTVNCTTTPGNPAQTSYRWTRSIDNWSQTGQSLSLPSVTKGDAAVYTCTAWNVMTPTGGSVMNGTDTEAFTVNVMYPPVINPLQSRAVIASSNLTVNCTTTPGNPAHTSYRWTRSTNNTWSQDGQALSLPNVIKGDAAVYTCTAWNIMTPTGGVPVTGNSAEAFIVEILYPPVINPLQDRDVIASSNVTVNCTTTPGNPAQTSYRWTRSIDNWSQTGQSLSLPSVTKGDAAVYTCTAWNVMTPTGGSVMNGTDTEAFTVNVMYPPVINPLQSRAVIASSNLTVNCTTTPGNPAQTSYRWTRSTNNTWSQDGQALSLPNVIKGDAAVYTCTAWNIMTPTGGVPVTGNSAEAFIVEILYPPVIYPLQDRDVIASSNVTVNCTTTPGNPAQTSYRWTRSIDNWSQTGQSLSLPSVTKGDAAVYTCTAWNVMTPTGGSVMNGTDTEAFTVNVMSSASTTPSTPTQSATSPISGSPAATTANTTAGKSSAPPSVSPTAAPGSSTGTPSKTPAATSTTGTPSQTPAPDSSTGTPSKTSVPTSPTSTQSTTTTPVDHCKPSPCVNGTCNDLGTGYNCTCDPGFTDKNCSTNIDDCAGVTCQHGGTCQDLVNDYVCKCATGWTDKNCTTNIDDCVNVTCQHGGTCEDLTNDYECNCVPGYTGKDCETDIDDCDGVDCKNGGTCIDHVNNYNCTCMPGFTGRHCETNINDCENVTCNNGGTCKDLVNNFTCECAAGWEGILCGTDIDECITNTHECHNRADCTNTVGDYNCTCNKGFEGDGKSCSDINECAANDGNGDCNATNTDLCFNMVGTYRCFCKVGWTGQRCEKDIDECRGTPCDADATCTNSPGSYRCTCNDGYRGNGETCTEIVLFSLPDAGETHVGDDNVFGVYRVDDGLPYQDKLYYKIYVNMNGFITLGKSYNGRYPPRTSAEWKSPGAPVIAPLWTDLEIKAPSSLTINAVVRNQTYLEDIVQRSKQQLQKPRYGFIATWTKAVPYPYNQNKNFESADFQVAIVTNGAKTVVIYNYDREYFTLDAEAIGRFTNIGYTDKTSHGFVMFDQKNFTQANQASNIGFNGRWVFDVSEPSNESETEATCQSWLSNKDIQDKLQAARARAMPCPCSFWQARRDGRFRYRTFTEIDKKWYYVFSSRFYRWPDYTRQRCHYSWPKRSLAKGYPGGGYLEFRDPDMEIAEAYKQCCSESKRLCKKFYKANPSNKCRNYRPPSWRPSWGDPHITTLDGQEYTFNGRGEYMLIQYENATVQARTELARAPSTDATVFVGLAARDLGGDKVELILNSSTKTCKIFINEAETATFPGGVEIDINATKVSVYEALNSTDNSLVVVLESGVSVQVTVSNILDLVTSVSGDATGQAHGLLGDFDEIPDNDFKMRNGTELSKDSSEKELFTFGSSWNIMANESLFTYTAAKNHSFYNNGSIVPNEFVGDITNLKEYLTKQCSSGINVDGVNKACGNNTACIIDAAATCNITFGERTKDTQEIVEQESTEINNEPPVFYNDDVIILRPESNKTIVLNVNGTGIINVTVDTTIDEKKYTFDKNTFTWFVGDTVSNESLKFEATDSLNASSEYWPDIHFCGCKIETECDYSEIGETSNDERFYRASCYCSEGMTGDFCKETVDPCDPCECWNCTSCNSSNSTAPCQPCPHGYEGDGYRCNDMDECRLNTSECSQICINKLGSYQCACNNGYTLDSDGHTCTDIDECSVGTPCTAAGQACWNTDGSFECRCLPGYTDNNGVCERPQVSYVLMLVFSVLQEDEQLIKDAIRNWLRTDVYKDIQTNLVSIDMKLTKVPVRRRRDTKAADGMVKYKSDVVLHSNDTSLNDSVVTQIYDNYTRDHAVGGKITSDDFPFPLEIDADESSIAPEGGDNPLCKDSFSKCDPVSTDCSVTNGQPKCTCKTGFEEWLVPQESCKDIDECQHVPSVCEGGNCSNTPGSYQCTCQPGYRYDGTSKCEDMCLSSPCQNDGECIHGTEEAQYICKCDDKWAGVNCERENEETTRLKTVAIIVGGVAGGVCLLLLVALFGMWRRSMSKRRGYTRQFTANGGYEFDNPDYITPRPNLTRDSKDAAPFDDENTTFSIPRPKVSRQEHEMTDLDAQSETSGNRGEYSMGKTDEENSDRQPLAAEPTAAASTSAATGGKRLSGRENPSFLHDSTTEKIRQPSGPSKLRSNYEYF